MHPPCPRVAQFPRASRPIPAGIARRSPRDPPIRPPQGQQPDLGSIVYRENPPDRAIAADDIVFLDFGPVFAEWEADFGRTFVLGDDPRKLRLLADLPLIFDAGRAWFEAHPDISGAELYRYVVGMAEAACWRFGGPHSGHLVGEFPHELIDGERIESYIAPGSTEPMRRADRSGRTCHWILEVHLVDPGLDYGGFYEQLSPSAARPTPGTTGESAPQHVHPRRSTGAQRRTNAFIVVHLVSGGRNAHVDQPPEPRTPPHSGHPDTPWPSVG